MPKNPEVSSNQKDSYGCKKYFSRAVPYNFLSRMTQMTELIELFSLRHFCL